MNTCAYFTSIARLRTPLISLVACRAMLQIVLAGDPVLVDFRNYIPGILDAPAYHVDGKIRLSTNYWAQLYAGLAEGPEEALTAVGSPIEFRGGQWAGYRGDVDGSAPIHVAVPGISQGQLMAVQIRAWQLYPGGSIPEVFPPHRLDGRSAVVTLVASSVPTPLIGLVPFRLQAARIQARREGDRWVLRWSAGDGSVDYDLETTSTLAGVGAWGSSGLQSVKEVVWLGETTWTASWVLTNTLTGPGGYYRLRLLNP